MIRGLQPLNNFPATTHQQFMDDTMLHGTPTVKEAKGFKNILTLFSQASGMDFNLEKSSVFFFNIHLAVQRHLTEVLGFKRSTLPSKYLGVPLTDKPWHKSHWEKLITKLTDKCNHWTNRVLNLAGRMVMTKAVLQAIPHYMLSILPAPQGILQKIRTMQRNFLWSGNSGKKKWALAAWDNLCRPKIYGGIGLQDPGITNKANGAKLWWRWLT